MLKDEEALNYYNDIKTNMIKIGENHYKLTHKVESYLSTKYLSALKKKEEGKNIELPKIPYCYNRNIANAFILKLQELAKNDGLYIEVKIVYDEAKESWIYDSAIMTSEHFEKLYGYPLEDFYNMMEEKALEKNKIFLRNELVNLKQCLRKEIKLKKEEDEIIKIYKNYYIYFSEIIKKYSYINKEFIEKLFEIDETEKILKLK